MEVVPPRLFASPRLGVGGGVSDQVYFLLDIFLVLIFWFAFGLVH